MAASAAIEAEKAARGIITEFMAWASKPVYQNVRTTTRSWTEFDKNGKAHTLTETKTHGWSVSNGMVLGGVVVLAAWEVGLAVQKAFGTSGLNAMDAAEILAAPVFIAYDEAGAIVGVINALTKDVWQLFGGGTQPVSQGNPPGTATVVQVPATAMAGISDFVRKAIAPANAMADNIGQRFLKAIANAPP